MTLRQQDSAAQSNGCGKQKSSLQHTSHKRLHKRFHDGFFQPQREVSSAIAALQIMGASNSASIEFRRHSCFLEYRNARLIRLPARDMERADASDLV